MTSVPARLAAFLAGLKRRRVYQVAAVYAAAAFVAAHWIAELYAAAGERERALDWLEETYATRSIQLVYIQLWPIWDVLRDEPRFTALLRRMNYPRPAVVARSSGAGYRRAHLRLLPAFARSGVTPCPASLPSLPS